MIYLYNEATWPTRTIAFTTVTNGAAWNPGPRAVWLWATADCYVAVGENAAATTASFPLTAFVPVIIGVPLGTDEPWRVSVVQKVGGGDLLACPCTTQQPVS